MTIKLAKKGHAKITITAKVPSDGRAGYDKKTFTARIIKLYGDAKKTFLDNLADRKDVDIARELVTELDKLEWFATAEDGSPLELKGDTLAEFFDLMEESQVDYIMAPLASECIKVQDEGMRRMLEAKN
ncbi:hypothetical protein [Zhongshania marina]|nr:hypothetical protein [Marortus luteolus]